LAEQAERQIDGADAHPLAPDHHRHGHLTGEPGQRWQSEQVVRQADHEETERARQRRPDQLVFGGREGAEAPQRPDAGERQREAQHHAHPA
jgi:hypothetical protein